MPKDKHFWFSMVKSALRIVGCIFGIFGGPKGLQLMAANFMFAEVLGILEEL